MMMRKVRDQPSATQEELVNDLKAVGTTVTKRTISNTLHREGLKSCCTRKFPLWKKAHVQARLKFAKEHLDDPEEAWEKVMRSDDAKFDALFWSQLDSSGLDEEKCWVQPQEHHPHCEAWRWKPYALGVFFQLKGQDDFTVSRGGWMGPYTGKFGATISFPRWEHWKWVVDESSNMTMTQKIWLREQRSGSKRSILRTWSGLASLQT